MQTKHRTENVPSIDELVNAIADYRNGKLSESALKLMGHIAKNPWKNTSLLQKFIGIVAYSEAVQLDPAEAKALVLDVSVMLENNAERNVPAEIVADVINVLDKCYITVWRDFCSRYDAEVFNLSDEEKEILARFEEALGKDDRDWVKDLPEIKETMKYNNDVQRYNFERDGLDSLRASIIEIVKEIAPEHLGVYEGKYNSLGYALENEHKYNEKIDREIRSQESGAKKRQKILEDWVEKGYLTDTRLANLWDAFVGGKGGDSIVKKPNEIQSYRDFIAGVRVAIKRFDNEPTVVRAKNLVKTIEKLQQDLKRNVEISQKIEKFGDYPRWNTWRTPRPVYGPVDQRGRVQSILYLTNVNRGYEYFPSPELECEYYKQFNNLLYRFINMLADKGYVPKEIKQVAFDENREFPNNDELIKKLKQIAEKIDNTLDENDKFLQRQTLPKKLGPVLNKEPSSLYARK